MTLYHQSCLLLPKMILAYGLQESATAKSPLKKRTSLKLGTIYDCPSERHPIFGYNRDLISPILPATSQGDSISSRPKLSTKISAFNWYSPAIQHKVKKSQLEVKSRGAFIFITL